MRVRLGELVDLVQFTMADGSTDDGGYLSEGGQLQPAFVLEPGEQLVRIDASQSPALHALRLRTNKGRESPWYGNPSRGTVQVFEGSTENPIIGIKRDSATGTLCPRIAWATLLDGSAAQPVKPEDAQPLPARSQADTV